MDFLKGYVAIARKLERQHGIYEHLRKQSVVNVVSSLSPEYPELTKLLPTLPDLTTTASPALEWTRKTTVAALSLATRYASVVIPFEAADGIAREWEKRMILPADVTLQTLSPVLQSHLAWTARLSVLAEASLSLLASANVGQLLGLPAKAQHVLDRGLLSTSRSYARLSLALEKHPAFVLRMPPQVTTVPPMEHFNMVDFVALASVDVSQDELADEKRHVRNEIASEVEGDLETSLAGLDSSLITLWRGGREALEADNPDRVRHFCTSFRELFTHVLHQLAPDDEVIGWSSTPDHLDDHGRPTRKARLLYICRNINYDPFADFLMKDISALLDLVELLQRGTHGIDPRFTPAQLTALRIRAESALLSMIETSRADCALLSVRVADPDAGFGHQNRGQTKRARSSPTTR